jgi:hypothetical protein
MTDGHLVRTLLELVLDDPADVRLVVHYEHVTGPGG